MGEQLKLLQETIERRELENQFGGRLPLLKHKRNFKDPATEPKKMPDFMKDDEELE
jgi:hypothetical protein